MYTAYYDASGSEDEMDAPLVIAAVLSTEERWRRLQREWVETLGEYELTYLHMRDFAHFQPPFDRFKNDPVSRAACLDRLIHVAKRGVRMAFVTRIVPADYYAVNERYVLQDDARPSPFPFLALPTHGLVEQWLQQEAPGAALAHVAESGDTGQAVMNRWIQVGYPLTIRAKTDSKTGVWFPPFQVADLVAYEYRLAIQRLLKRSTRPRRRSILTIHSRIPVIAKQFGQKELFSLCRNNPSAHPRRRSHANF